MEIFHCTPQTSVRAIVAYALVSACLYTHNETLSPAIALTVSRSFSKIMV